MPVSFTIPKADLNCSSGLNPSGMAKRSLLTSTREILSTSFSIKVGETLVVGTSKLDGGDEALVVLLTAEP